MAAVLVLLGLALFPAQGVWRFFALALLIACGGASYFGAAHLLKAIDLGELRRLLRRRKAGA
jgi:putative peptidoglycan lipid II flippase